MGAVLLQLGDNGLQPVSFISRRLSDSETRYHSNELECLALVWALKKFHSYIYGRPFSVQTDNSALTWLFSKKDINGKFARWVLSLADYDFKISHVKGVQNCVADALSRNPIIENGILCLSLASGKFTEKDIAFLQQLDEDFKTIIYRLHNPEITSSTKYKVSDFVLKNGVLYRKNFSPYTGRKFVLAVPSGLRRDLLYACHDDPEGGHLGIDKTLARISSRYWWPQLTNSVRRYVLSCIFCQCHKSNSCFPPGPLSPISPPTRPFELLGIDHLGPFKETKDGNQHIVVIIDYLTRFVEAFAVPDTSSHHVLQFLYTIFLRHGYPSRLISDQGSAFTSQSFDTAMKNWNICHTLSTAEHPQTNGLVEIKTTGTE